MTIKKLTQLVNIPDFRYESDCSNIEYGDIACDCDSKTISILDAIQHISLSILSMHDDDNSHPNKREISTLSAVISDLADLAISTNKIAQAASYLSGVKDGTHVA